MKKAIHNMQAMGLQELPPEVSRATVGGMDLVSGIIGALAYLAKKCVDDWQCLKDGLAGNLCTHGKTHS